MSAPNCFSTSIAARTLSDVSLGNADGFRIEAFAGNTHLEATDIARQTALIVGHWQVPGQGVLRVVPRDGAYGNGAVGDATRYGPMVSTDHEAPSTA